MAMVVVAKRLVVLCMSMGKGLSVMTSENTFLPTLPTQSLVLGHTK